MCNGMKTRGNSEGNFYEPYYLRTGVGGAVVFDAALSSEPSWYEFSVGKLFHCNPLDGKLVLACLAC